MQLIGRWKIKEMHIPTPDGVQTYTPETLPEEFTEDWAQMLTMLLEFTEDGSLNTLQPVTEELAATAQEEDLTIREDGFVVVESTTWKERDGKFFFDSQIEGEILGETVDPFMEIEVTSDGCLLYNFGMLLLERA